MFGFVLDHRLRLFISQVALVITAATSIGFATLVGPMVNEGVVGGDTTAAIHIGLWMFVLAAVSGAALAIAASSAVFFSQGIGYELRKRLYEKIQMYTFENFDRLSSSQLMVRLNADMSQFKSKAPGGGGSDGVEFVSS